MTVLAEEYDELIEHDAKMDVDEKFAKALGDLLAEARPFPRVTLNGVRYCNIAGLTEEELKAVAAQRPRIYTMADILRAQRDDLEILRGQMKDTVRALREVMPLTEKGEFAAMMLSGRKGFADKVQQSVDLLGSFTRFYTQSCQTSIAATMQTFPSGWEWLKGWSGKGMD